MCHLCWDEVDPHATLSYNSATLTVHSATLNGKPIDLRPNSVD